MLYRACSRNDAEHYFEKAVLPAPTWVTDLELTASSGRGQCQVDSSDSKHGWCEGIVEYELTRRLSLVSRVGARYRARDHQG
jgi:hypothetical protein